MGEPGDKIPDIFPNRKARRYMRVYRKKNAKKLAGLPPKVVQEMVQVAGAEAMTKRGRVNR